ncbi:MAG: TolC family protein [Deltaproteobacteria bacterium]|nr:TolC family protein [Deltaproteobacteria bacterium]
MFVGGQGVAERRGAQAAVDAANVELAQAEQDLEVATASAVANHRAAAASAEARKVALDAAGDAFADVDARYQAGLVSLTDWLDARRARDAAAVSLALAEAGLGAALAELEATTGVY